MFIDFFRDPEKPQDIPCSLFSHQELALAYHVRFQEMIALQQKGAPREGFLNYVLSNPEPFNNETDLLRKIKCLVKERKWSPDYSRNLVIREIGFTDPLQYRDHTGASFERVWQVRVENKRPDVAAVYAVCILDFIKTNEGNRIESQDRSYLKWAGQMGYDRTILPKDFGDIDLFAIRANEPGLYLHSSRDTPREPILKDNGDYELFFKLFSRGFPLVDFSVKVKLRWTSPRASEWKIISTAKLISKSI